MGVTAKRWTQHSLLLACVFHSTISMFIGTRPLPLCQQVVPNTPDPELQINCLVPSGQFLDYRDIRTLTGPTAGNQKYNVTIDCQGGRIYLPFPFRARNVVSLSVSGCEVEGYFAERETTTLIPYPDEIRNLSIVDIAIVVSSKELLDMVTKLKRVSRDYECGLSSARRQVFRNVHYIFPDVLSVQNDIVLMEALMNSNLEEELMQPKYRCSFPHLDYLEQTGSRSLSKAHFKLFENNEYPKLRAFVFRNNSLPSIPQEMRNLNLAFLPNLEVLDFSDNKILNVDFVFSGLEPRTNLLYIDLRQNRIQHLSSTVVEHVVKSGKVIMDLRENPLQCSCELNIYKDYLLQHGGMDARFLADTPCTSTRDGVTVTYNILDKNFGERFCSQIIPQVVSNMISA